MPLRSSLPGANHCQKKNHHEESGPNDGPCKRRCRGRPFWLGWWYGQRAQHTTPPTQSHKRAAAGNQRTCGTRGSGSTIEDPARGRQLDPWGERSERCDGVLRVAAPRACLCRQRLVWTQVWEGSPEAEVGRPQGSENGGYGIDVLPSGSRHQSKRNERVDRRWGSP